MALATNTTPGEIQLAGDLAGNNDATAPELTDLGIISGQYVYPSITVDAKGRITNITSGDPTTLSSLLPPASSTTKGTIQAGLGLSVNQNALAGYQDVLFSTSLTGTESSGLSTCATYSITISVDFGTQQVIQISNVILTTINDVINQINLSLIGATASITNGNIRFISNTVGRSSVIEINADNIFKCMVGFVNINSSENGLASCELNSDIATNSQLGVVKIGSGLSIDGAGLLSMNTATTTSLGVVQVGAGLTVDVAGVIAADAVPDATTTSKGIVQIGSGINVVTGVISAVQADNTVKGIVNSANPSNITITSGSVNTGTNVALLNTNNAWTTAQTVIPVALPPAVNVITDAYLSNIFTIALDQNIILDNPTNLVSGGKYSFILSQDVTGGRTITYGSIFKFKNGSDNVLSTAAFAVGILTCVSDGTNLYCALAKEFV